MAWIFSKIVMLPPKAEAHSRGVRGHAPSEKFWKLELKSDILNAFLSVLKEIWEARIQLLLLINNPLIWQLKNQYHFIFIMYCYKQEKQTSGVNVVDLNDHLLALVLRRLGEKSRFLHIWPKKA